VPRKENAELYRRYEHDAEQLPNVTFVGRLATYKYYNMDQVVGQALTAFKRLQKTLLREPVEVALAAAAPAANQPGFMSPLESGRAAVRATVT
jgi:UDP-galactopyranose mutase